MSVRACRDCGCTDDDCSLCIERTGMPCFWVAPDLCSACLFAPQVERATPSCHAAEPSPEERP